MAPSIYIVAVHENGSKMTAYLDEEKAANVYKSDVERGLSKALIQTSPFKLLAFEAVGEDKWVMETINAASALCDEVTYVTGSHQGHVVGTFHTSEESAKFAYLSISSKYAKGLWRVDGATPKTEATSGGQEWVRQASALAAAACDVRRK